MDDSKTWGMKEYTENLKIIGFMQSRAAHILEFLDGFPYRLNGEEDTETAASWYFEELRKTAYGLHALSTKLKPHRLSFKVDMVLFHRARLRTMVQHLMIALGQHHLKELPDFVAGIENEIQAYRQLWEDTLAEERKAEEEAESGDGN